MKCGHWSCVTQGQRQKIQFLLSEKRNSLGKLCTNETFQDLKAFSCRQDVVPEPANNHVIVCKMVEKEQGSK